MPSGGHAGKTALPAGELGTPGHPCWQGISASQAPLPDRVLAGRQELELLKGALAVMPPLRRDVLVRRRLQGQSCAAIARDLGLSPKAVEKHITRGLADLHKAMGDDAAACGGER